MRKKTVKVFAALAAAAVMMFGTLAVSAEESYTTKPGDTLQKIAKEAYGDAGKWNVIYEANKDQIKNPNKIWANQTLILPGAGSATTDTSNESTDTATSEETTNTSTSDVTVDASTLLQTVYNLMGAQDYAGMRTVDGSDEAAAYVNAMTSDRAVYIPDGSLTGTGAGVYKDGDGGYYFYYGDYVDGIRCGNGTSFISYSDGIEVFTGAWDNDAPNGQGTKMWIGDNESYMDGYYGHQEYIHSGNLTDGLWNGTVNITYTNYQNDHVYWICDKISFVADHGVATEDKTDEYLSHTKRLWENYEDYYYTMEDFLWEGRIVYAYGGDAAELRDGVEQYYDDARAAFYCVPGSRLGVYGWAD